jgi:hypothetical protein
MYLSPQLQVFSSIASYFQQAALRGNMSAAFDVVNARLGYVATQISDCAEAKGYTQTDTTGVVATFGGEATAIGDNSKVSCTMRGNIQDVGLVTYAVGTCTFTAVAEASGDGTAVAYTESFAHVSGADFVIIINTDYSTPLEAGADFAFSTSSSSFIAIDLEYWDSARGPIYIEYDRVLGRYAVCGELDDGEMAVLDAVLDSFGGDTFASLDANVLTIEDTLSTVSAVATLAVA